jgi:hypothetical protein
MTSSPQIKAYLSVCDDAPTFIVADKLFKAGTRQEFHELQLSILDGDILSITIPGHIRMKVGGASMIKAISVRYCAERGTIIPIYKDDEMNLMGCCVHCGGWTMCGSSNCECQFIH